MFDLYVHLIDLYTQAKWKIFGHERAPTRNSLEKKNYHGAWLFRDVVVIC